MEKIEKEKDRQDSEIESIIQVKAEGISDRIMNYSKVLTFIFVLQHARELETRRREAEEKERRKQKEVQMELERQLKEAETVRESFPGDNVYLQSQKHWHYKSQA